MRLRKQHMSSPISLHRNLSHAIAVALAATLSACAVGPNFERPAGPVSDRYSPQQEQAPSLAGTDVIAQQVSFGGNLPGNWWSLFNNDGLNQLIDEALANNQSLAAAQATVQQAQALAEARTGARYPELDLTASSGREKYGAQFLGSFPAPPPFTYYAFGTAVSYTLDYVGGTKRSIEQQHALTEYRRQQLLAARLTVAGNIVMRVLEVAAIEAEIRTIEELLVDDRRNVEMVQAAFSAGSVSRVGVLSAQSQLASDATLLPARRQQLSQSRAGLASLLGREPGTLSPVSFDLAAFELPQQLPLELPSDFVHQRPDILAAEAQLHAATAEVGIATANLYPRITLNASFGLQSIEAGGLFNKSSEAWGLTGNLVAPIFDGGRLRAEKRAAVAALSAQAARYRQVVIDSFVQVAEALDGINHSAELLAAQSQALTVAQQNLELTRESFNEGNVGVLQVLDSERLYQQARLGYVRAQAQRLQTTAQLFAAVGRSG